MRGSRWWGEPRPPRAHRPHPAPGRGMLLTGSAGTDSADSLSTRRKGISRAGARCCRPAPRGRGGLLCALGWSEVTAAGCRWARGAGGMAWESLWERACPQGQQQQRQPQGLAMLHWHRPGLGYLPAAAFQPRSLPLRDPSSLLASGGGGTRLDSLSPALGSCAAGGRAGQALQAERERGANRSEGESATGEFPAVQLELTLACTCQPFL